MKVHPLLKKKWFWISFLGFLLFAFLFDIFIASTILFKSLTSGRWNHLLLSVGIIYALLSAYRPFIQLRHKKRLSDTTRLLWIICFIWAVHEYGFWAGLFFIGTMTILSRFTGWILKLVIRKRRPELTFKGYE